MSQHQGVVKVYFKDKGYGFIESPQAGNIFFHISQVGASDSQRIGINDTVVFELEASRKKPGTYTAKNVSVIQG
jgi:cold shock CspA family protein